MKTSDPCPPNDITKQMLNAVRVDDFSELEK